MSQPARCRRRTNPPKTILRLCDRLGMRGITAKGVAAKLFDVVDGETVRDDSTVQHERNPMRSQEGSGAIPNAILAAAPSSARSRPFPWPAFVIPAAVDKAPKRGDLRFGKDRNLDGAMQEIYVSHVYWLSELIWRSTDTGKLTGTISR